MVGTASVASAAVGRVVARVGADGVVNASTRFTDTLAGSNIRGATVAADGVTAWASGANGVSAVTIPHSNSVATSTSLNARNVQLYNHAALGQVLLAGAAASLVYQVAATALGATSFTTAVAYTGMVLDSQVERMLDVKI